MKIVILGLSITSAWGNGHATTFRALCRALHARGHRITFFEKNTEWYEHNRDMPDPTFCDVRIFDDWDLTIPEIRRELASADVAVLGSYFQDGIEAADLIIESSAEIKTFYDIDTPITIAALREKGRADYILASQVPEFDVYFSFTGGPILREIEERFASPLAVPLYCSFDSTQYRPRSCDSRFECDLSYMGTYAPDRQPKLEALLLDVARDLPERKFIVAGPQYPESIVWPENIGRITHLNPHLHPIFYSSSRMTLNVTRRDMVVAGYSPSVRLFEAAACGTCIVSDVWPGLETFFTAGREILIPESSSEMARYITGFDDSELRRIGKCARERVMEQHTSEQRVREFEYAIEKAKSAATRIPEHHA